MQPTLTPEYLASQGLSANFLKRFWKKVKKSDDCWLWTGARIKKGYGNIWKGFPKRPGFLYTITSHRASWIIHNGPVPDGLHVLHKCDNPSCVNPAHLFVGTPMDNTHDMIKKGRKWVNDLRGERIGTSKLTDEQVRQIRLALGGKRRGYKRVAALFGVSGDCIGDCARGKTWKHVL